MLESLLAALLLYGSGALACLATCALYVATVPRFTRHVFTSQARRLGIHPHALVALAVFGCAVAWPVTAVLVSVGRARCRS